MCPLALVCPITWFELPTPTSLAPVPLHTFFLPSGFADLALVCTAQHTHTHTHRSSMTVLAPKQTESE
jgi:hypothetical protein